MGGRLVRRLVNRGFEAGEHEVVWDRLDSGGRPLSRGMYLTRVTYSNQRFMVAKKLTIMQ